MNNSKTSNLQWTAFLVTLNGGGSTLARKINSANLFVLSLRPAPNQEHRNFRSFTIVNKNLFYIRRVLQNKFRRNEMRNGICFQGYSWIMNVDLEVEQEQEVNLRVPDHAAFFILA